MSTWAEVDDGDTITAIPPKVAPSGKKNKQQLEDGDDADAADQANATPVSPTSPASVKKVSELYTRHDGKKVRVIKKVTTREIQRPVTMKDIRARNAAFNGVAEALKDGTAATSREAAISLELSNMDPLEKACRDEVQRQLNVSMQTKFEQTPELDRLRKQLAKTDVTGAAAAAAAAADAQQQAGGEGGEDGEPKEKRTWAQGRQEKKKQDTSNDGKEVVRNVIRISNLSDEIQESELKRLFGKPNGLGDIKRLFIAKDNEGGRKGFAYITYSTEAEATAAVGKMHRKDFKHVILLVDYGTAQRPRNADGSSRGGPRK